MVHFIWPEMTATLFFISSDQSRYALWSCQNVCVALSFLLDNICVTFGTKFYRQIVGIPMGTNCAPLVADLLEKVPQDLFHSVYFEYEENYTHDRLLSLNYAFCHIKRLLKTSEPVYTD